MYGVIHDIPKLQLIPENIRSQNCMSYSRWLHTNGCLKFKKVS
jgi:hypothetical protein